MGRCGGGEGPLGFPSSCVRPWGERLDSQMAVIEPEGVGREKSDGRKNESESGGKGGWSRRRMGRNGDVVYRRAVDLRLQSEAGEKLNGESA